MTTSSKTRSRPRLGRRLAGRFAPAAVPLLAFTCLFVGSSAASAGPAPSDPTGCSATLAQAAVWPGTIPVGEGTHRIYSDAFYSYLDRQPPCAPSQ